MTSVSFKISSALKTIIGKELITDRQIAILELVKNSFDASASRVEVSFLKEDEEFNKIVIQDDGHGMSKDDILNKWLFLAYSGKRDSEDFREKGRERKIYAGAKGIGRFSCDRLGSHLRMYTRPADSKIIHQLDVDWADFEIDQEREFQTIPAHYKAVTTTPYELENGTVLEITRLDKQAWDREELLELKRKLERLINPNQENELRKFKITINVPSEKEADSKIRQASAKINGEVKNRIFENLGIKTTQIARDDAAQKGQHLILQETTIIISHAEGLISAIRRSQTNVPERWLERLYQIIKSAKKAEALSRYSTHANYQSDSDELTADLISYISQYTSNVLKGKSPEIEDRPSIPVVFRNENHYRFPTKFMPIRMIIVLDNLIFNSLKHDASKIVIEPTTCTESELIIKFSDNGKGVKRGIERKIFDAGFTTTNGSGLGLYHAQQLMTELGGSISLDENFQGGASFFLRFKK